MQKTVRVPGERDNKTLGQKLTAVYICSSRFAHAHIKKSAWRCGISHNKTGTWSKSLTEGVMTYGNGYGMSAMSFACSYE